MPSIDFKVWDNYLALHRYMLPLGSVDYDKGNKKGLVVPRALPSRPVLQKHLVAVRRIEETLSHIWLSHPALVTPEYYCYLYLFCQLLRCSYRHKPFLTEHGRWKGLAWFPIQTLVGKPGVEGKDSAAKRAWYHWYYLYVTGPRPRSNQKALEQMFPWIPPAGESDVILVRQQLAVLKSIGTIEPSLAIRNYESDGQPIIRMGFPVLRRKESRPWHPWIYLGQVGCWKAGLCEDIRVREAVNRMMEDKTLWKLWWKLLPEICPDIKERKMVLKELDNCINPKKPGTKRAWRLLRTAWARELESEWQKSAPGTVISAVKQPDQRTSATGVTSGFVNPAIPPLGG